MLDDKGKQQRELKSGDEVPRGAYLESTVEAQPTDPAGLMRFVLVENPRPAGGEVLPVFYQGVAGVRCRGARRGARASFLVQRTSLLLMVMSIRSNKPRQGSVRGLSGVCQGYTLCRMSFSGKGLRCPVRGRQGSCALAMHGNEA